MKSTYIILFGSLLMFASCIDKSAKDKAAEKSDEEFVEVPLGDTLFLGFRENMSTETFKVELDQQVKEGVLRKRNENNVEKVFYSFFIDSKECRSELVPKYGNTGLMEVQLKLSDTFEDKDYLKSILDIYTKKYEFNQYKDTVAHYDDYFTHMYYWEEHLKKEGVRASNSSRRAPSGALVAKIQESGLPCKEGCTVCNRYLNFPKERLERISYEFLGYFDIIYHTADDRKLVIAVEPKSGRFHNMEIRYLPESRYDQLLHRLEEDKKQGTNSVKYQKETKKKEDQWKTIREQEFEREI